MKAEPFVRSESMDAKSPFWKRPFLLGAIAILIVSLGVLASMTASRAQKEAQRMELRNVQQAVSIMMADNDISILPNPVVLPASDMSLFPDATTPPEVKGLLRNDKPGYVLRGHDNTKDGQPEPEVDYLGSQRTGWTYTVTRAGIVHQGRKAEDD